MRAQNLLDKNPLPTITIPYEGNNCRLKIEKDLKNWKSLNKWRQTLDVDPRTFERAIYVTPTKEFAQWVRLEKNRGKITLYKVTPFNTLKLIYQNDCSPKSSFYPRSLVESKNKQDFSDQELKTILQKNKQGLIYVWSQQNSMWLEGIKLIKQVAFKHQLPLLILCDKEFSKAAQNEVKKMHPNFDLDNFRFVNSIELEFLGAKEKSPSLLFYQSGKIYPDLIFGVKNKSTYDEFLRPLLKTKYSK